MSTTSTPSLSPKALSDSQESPAILTPGAKVRALLAQFDSDSEADQGQSKQSKTPTPGDPERKSLIPKSTRPNPSVHGTTDSNDEEDDDDLPIAHRRRIGGRLQSPAEEEEEEEKAASAEDEDAGAAYGRIRDQLLHKSGHNFQSHNSDDSKDAPPRKHMLKRKNSPTADWPAADSPSRSVSPLFFPSPSPSKRTKTAPAAQQVTHASASEDESENDLQKRPNPRFMALVEKQRKARLEKEAAEAKKRANRIEQLNASESRSRAERGSSPADLFEDDFDSGDDASGKKLTQHARPTRKASKKALEDMNRETQRMSRNMQLAHQAQTRKKISKASLFAKFNFPIPGATKDLPSSATASSAPNSDGDSQREHSTPPTSPIREEYDGKELAVNPSHLIGSGETRLMQGDKGELPTLEDIMTQAVAIPDKGRGEALERKSVSQAASVQPQHSSLSNRTFRVRLSKEDIVMSRGDLSDDDLEVITSQSAMKRVSVFERIPKRKAREATSHLMLRSLAHMNSPSKRGDKKRSTMTAAEMDFALRRQARLQAAKDRAEKIEELKAKGVYVQTAEERDKEQQEVEDLVERARQEGAEIQRREKSKAKKDGTFENDGLGDSDDEDEDYEGDEHLALSGSDEDEEAESDAEDDKSVGEEDDEESDHTKQRDLLDAEASEADSSEEVDDDDAGIEKMDDTLVDGARSDSDAEALPQLPQLPSKRRMTQRVLIDSDDEEDPVSESDGESNRIDFTPDLPALSTPKIDAEMVFPAETTKTPVTISRSARKVIPGLPLSDDMPIGLTQAFAATMADSQTQESPATQEQDSLELVRDLPDPHPALKRIDSIDVVTDSQPPSQTQPLGLELNLTQDPWRQQTVRQSRSGVSASQFSEIPEPTQDTGYMFSPILEKRFDTPMAPHSTIDTVILPKDDSPLVQRRGRLHRRIGRAVDTESDDEDAGPSNISAFDTIRRAARDKAQQGAFDKQRSIAKEAIDEAAEESEDEYAGLGGVSDDDAGEENEEDRKMINDDSKEKVNERELAAFHADKERAQDSAAVSKLLEDITTGRLRRRKRGGGDFDDLDLSDEDSAHARRREAKRREFAKMRRELLLHSDERIGKIAGDPKKNAFLKAIEDQDEEDDLIDLDLELHETSEESQSQTQPAVEVVQSTQDEAPAKEAPLPSTTKSPLEPSRPTSLNRAESTNNLLRKKASTQRPQTLAEIRESVSFLMDDPIDGHASYLSDSESDAEAHENLDENAVTDALMEELDKENDDEDDMDDFIVQDEEPIGEKSIFKKPNLPASRAPFSQRRTQPRGPVVDRLSLLRQSSSSSSASGVNGKMAFLTSPSASSLSFKVPSLLRRATTNSSCSSGSTTSATGVTTSTERGSAGSEKNIVRKGSGGQKSSVGYYRKSHAEQRAEDMRKRLEGRSKAVGRSTKAKFGGTSILGNLVKRDSWN